MIEFVECDACRAKPGSPLLCSGCLHNRKVIGDLRDAIKTHRSQRADDRCIEDDDRLYAVLGDGIKCDRRVGDKAQMLENCARFIELRCESGTWPSYADLEARIEGLEAELHQWRQGDPGLDLINANRDEILLKHEEAVRRMRNAARAGNNLLVIAIAEALNLFHPMHAESWKGWPNERDNG